MVITASILQTKARKKTWHSRLQTWLTRVTLDDKFWYKTADRTSVRVMKVNQQKAIGERTKRSYLSRSTASWTKTCKSHSLKASKATIWLVVCKVVRILWIYNPGRVSILSVPSLLRINSIKVIRRWLCTRVEKSKNWNRTSLMETKVKLVRWSKRDSLIVQTHKTTRQRASSRINALRLWASQRNAYQDRKLSSKTVRSKLRQIP